MGRIKFLIFEIIFMLYKINLFLDKSNQNPPNFFLKSQEKCLPPRLNTFFQLSLQRHPYFQLDYDRFGGSEIREAEKDIDLKKVNYNFIKLSG